MNKRIWEIFPGACSCIQADHERFGLRHHDIQHAKSVGDRAYRIALDEWGDEQIGRLAGLAGLCHNADRIKQAELQVGRRDVSPDSVIELTKGWLDHTDLGEFERSSVIQAVLKHDGRNLREDPAVQVALMDADRVVNLGLLVVLRAGQYCHDLPVVDYEHFLSDPEATYKNPKSALFEFSLCLEWMDPMSPYYVRTRMARQMGEERASRLRWYITQVKKQLIEDGVLQT